MYASIKPLIKLKKELNLLDYIVPENLKIKPGQLVEIPFRNRNIYGVVFGVQGATDQPKDILKSITKIINETPLFSVEQIDFFNFFVEHNFSSLNFLNNITPLPLKRKTNIAEEKINVRRINWKEKAIPDFIFKNKEFIFKHNHFIEKISLIKKTIDQNQQTLIISPTKLHLEKIYSYLLNFFKAPEIALITGSTHLNKTKHNQVWHNIQNNKVKIILGTKVSIFYPSQNISSIIVDEIENENHNQIDINPRFEFLPNVLELNKINNCQLILTSYAPPATLYHLAQEKKIKLLESKTRVRTKIKVPEMNTKYFANQIHFDTEEYINETLEKKGKILFLINKKGYSKSLNCPDCKFVFQCPDCDSIPTFKANNTLFCYNCQKEIEVPSKCPKCGNINLKTKGIGGNQLLSKIKETYPQNKVILIDKDHEDNLKLIKENEIIVATKLILNHFPEQEFDLIVLPLTHQFLNSNFDSNEKFYQFISSLISLQANKIVLQVLSELKIYDYIKHQKYHQMVQDELEFRKLFKYPPFWNILQITIKDKDQKTLITKTKELYAEIEKKKSKEVELMPIINPNIKRTFSFYLKHIMLKYEQADDLESLEPLLKKIDIIDKNYFKL